MVIIGVIGQPENETHTSIARSLEHTGVSTAVRWIRTTEVDNTDLSSFDAIWCAPGTPYTSMEGALAGIRFAREYGMPFLGTCAGFQHAILEFGRNVLDIRDAASEEYTIAGAPLFISRLSCSLIGNLMPVRLEAGSRARDAYGSDHAVERYYCNFGLNSRWEPQLTSAGLLITGRDSGPNRFSRSLIAEGSLA